MPMIETFTNDGVKKMLKIASDVYAASGIWFLY